MFGIIISIASIVIMFKLTWFVLKVCGKLLGVILSVFGYMLLGGMILALSLPVIMIVVALISGVFSLITGWRRIY